MVYTPIGQRIDVKMFKSLQWHHSPAAGGSTVSFEHVDVITMVDNITVYSRSWKIVVELLSISRNLLTYTGENNISIK